MAKYRCPDCGYIYDETAGHPHEGFLPGTPWSAVPQSWCCPDCAVRDKVDFELIERSPVGPPLSVAVVATRSAPATAQASATVAMERPVASAQSNAAPVADAAWQQVAGVEAPAGAPYRKWICITCGHIYDEALGDEREGFAPGTLFQDIPDDWCCPDCGATKKDYVHYEEK